MIIGNNVKLTNVNPLKFSSTNKVSDNKNIQLFNTKSAKPVENTPTIEKLRLLEALEQGLTDEVIRGMLEDFEYISDFGVTDNNLIIYEKPANDNLMTISVYDTSFEKIGNKRILKSYTFNRTQKAISEMIIQDGTKNSTMLYLMENTPDGKFLFTQIKDYHNWDDSILNPDNSNSEQMLYDTLEDLTEKGPSSTWYKRDGIVKNIKDYDYENKTLTEYSDNGEVKSRIKYKDKIYGEVISSYTKIDNPNYMGKAYYSVERKDYVITITNCETSEEEKIDLDKLFKRFNGNKKTDLIREFLSLPGECLMDFAKEICEPISVDVPMGAAGVYKLDNIALLPNVSSDIIAHELGHAIDDVVSEVSYFYPSSFENDVWVNNYKEVFEKELKDCGLVYDGTNPSIYCTKNIREMFAECYTLLMCGNCQSAFCILKYFPKTLENVKQHIEHIRSLPQEVRCKR